MNKIINCILQSYLEILTDFHAAEFFQVCDVRCVMQQSPTSQRSHLTVNRIPRFGVRCR